MSEHKAFASLSSGLLARKGDARPAMRRQSFGEMGQGLDDLGWNDMGEETPAPGEESADTAPRPGFVQGRYDDGDDNDKGVLAALGPLAGLSAAKAVQDHIQSESQQANSVREQQADIMKHFAVSDDEAWCDGEDYIDETAEEWDPEAEDAGGNAFNEHKGIAKDYSAHKDMADLDPMQLAEPTKAPAGFVPFAAQEDEPEAVEDTPVVDEAPADISEGPPVQDKADEAFDAAADEVTQVDTFEEDEEAAFAAETEEVVAETHDDVTVDEGDEEPAAHESTLYDLEFVGDIAEDEDAVAEHGAIIDQPVDETDDKVPFDLPEAAEIEAVEDVSGAEAEPLEHTNTVEEEEDALELTDAIEAEDDALELTDAIEDEKDEDTLAAQADEEDELVLDASADAKTEMVDPFANADESVDDVAITPAAEPAVEISKVVPLSAPVRPRRPRAAAGSKEKAAFTLRLDKERHLKLRLASALTGQSSQKLLIEALDRMLADMPELDTISNKEVG